MSNAGFVQYKFILVDPEGVNVLDGLTCRAAPSALPTKGNKVLVNRLRKLILIPGCGLVLLACTFAFDRPLSPFNLIYDVMMRVLASCPTFSPNYPRGRG